jgi:DNA invertase Pin-like site-specific DNA recombinase
MGRLIFHINSAYAEFEREIIGERVRAGIKAKREKNNNQWGRKALASELQKKIRDLIIAKHSIRTIAKMLNMSTRTVMKYR